jgi:hypothetical protein
MSMLWARFTATRESSTGCGGSSSRRYLICEILRRQQHDLSGSVCVSGNGLGWLNGRPKQDLVGLVCERLALSLVVLAILCMQWMCAESGLASRARKSGTDVQRLRGRRRTA